MKIWITGHTGMVGKALQNLIKKTDNDIIFRSRKELDLTDFLAVKHFLENNHCDWIFITAGKVGGIQDNINYPLDYFYENFMINNNILRAASEKKIKKVMILGSSCMYPKDSKQPISENTLLSGKIEKTNEGYGLAKLMSVKLAELYHIQKNCNFISVVPSAIYGPNDCFDVNRNHVIPALIKKIHLASLNNKKKVFVWGSGDALREFIFVDDLVDGLNFLMHNYNSSEPINIGSGFEIKIRDLVQEISKIIGFNGQIVFDKSKPEGVLRKCLDSSKIFKMGWKPKISFTDGLKKTIESYINSIKI